MAANNPSGIGFQIPRNSLALLMVAQAAVVLPHFAQLSPWIILVGLLCGLWRTRVYQGRIGYPSRAVKTFFVVLGTVGVFVSAASALSLEVFVSMLILAFAFKLVEMKTRRDAVVVIFLCYFIIAAQFLFEQTLPVALYELAATMLVTAALVGLNQMHTEVRPWASIRLAAGLVAQAIPLAVVLFLFFPRLMPLWSMPLPGSVSSGLSEEMTPGDIANLSQSDELAFRVEFDGEMPAYRELYWRAVVYSEFLDGTWKMLEPIEEPAVLGRSGSRDVSYEVLMTPTARKWIYALDVPIEQDARATLQSDFHLEVANPITSVFRYRVRSALAHFRGPDLSPEMRARETRVPEGDNPRLVAYARDLYARYPDTREFAEEILKQIRNEPYVYTLSPPTLPQRDSIDAFWFDSRRGFCAHYAGAFVYAMRSVGIPARLVGGYLGGEVNPNGGYLVVRQFDAHGWAEVWIAGEGWVRVDPTSAVAPNRIESGLASALAESERSNLSLLTNARFDTGSLLSRVLMTFDSIDHRWNMFVVGYDGQVQQHLLGDWFGNLKPGRTALIMVALGGVCFGLVAFVMFFQRRPVSRNPSANLIHRFVRFAGRYGFDRPLTESPQAFVRRVSDGIGNDAIVGETVALEVESMLYGGEPLNREALNRLRSTLRRLQVSLALTLR